MRKKGENFLVPSRNATKVGPNTWYADNDKLKGGWRYQDKEGTLSKTRFNGPMGPRSTQTTSIGESSSTSRKATLAAFEKLRRRNAKKQKPDGYGLK